MVKIFPELRKKLLLIVVLSFVVFIPFTTHAFTSPSLSLLQISSFFPAIHTTQEPTTSIANTVSSSPNIHKTTPISTFSKNDGLNSLEAVTDKTIVSGPIVGYPVKIAIPSLGISSSIEQVGYTLVNGARTWEVPKINVGTPRDQVKNNVILIGHTGIYSSIFEKLQNIPKGAFIELTGTNGTYRYIVTKNTTVNLRDLSFIMPQETPHLTLITCVTDNTSLRRIVVAVPK